MNYENLEENLKKEISPCYMINGGESFLTVEALKLIEENLNLSLKDFNKSVFKDDSLSRAVDIVASCEALPFCDEKRLVVVHDYLGKKNEEEKKCFIKYLNKPNTTTCLVFFSTIKSDFFSSLEGHKNICQIDCGKLPLNTLSKITNQKATEKGVKLSRLALNVLIEYCNFSVTKCLVEIEKFSTNPIFFERELTEKDVEDNVAKDIEYAIFDLTNAISQKQNDKVFLLIDTMLKNKEQPSTIITVLTNHFRRLFLISRSSISTNELSKYLNVKEYAIGKYREQVRFFSQRQLKDIFDKCVDVDFKSKSGQIDAKDAIYYLIASILN